MTGTVGMGKTQTQNALFKVKTGWQHTGYTRTVDVEVKHHKLTCDITDNNQPCHLDEFMPDKGRLLWTS